MNIICVGGCIENVVAVLRLKNGGCVEPGECV